VSTAPRWRLVLGRYAEAAMPQEADLDERTRRLDAALEFLYGREYRGRGLRDDGPKQAGSLDATQVEVLRWLHEVRELFPRDTCEILEKHALDRYGMTELVTDPQTLERLQPNQQLLRTILSLRGSLHADVLHVARRIVRQVTDEIRRQLEPQVRAILAGRLHRFRHAPFASLANFDVAGTVRTNLRHWDANRRRLAIERLRFFDRNQRRLPWDVILCVDQSGSMVDSVIHSAVMAGILAGLPSLRVKLVVFDTSIVDLSDHLDDPVETLLRVQLGGGTDIGQALRYCSQLVDNPHRTVLVLVSDFCEGAQPSELVRATRKLAEARVRLLGLASLDDQAAPAYDRTMAEQLAACGMEIAALTPARLAQWLLRVIS
jgi:Mg-chelatase subunit ChlD